MPIFLWLGAVPVGVFLLGLVVLIGMTYVFLHGHDPGPELGFAVYGAAVLPYVVSCWIGGTPEAREWAIGQDNFWVRGLLPGSAIFSLALGLGPSLLPPRGLGQALFAIGFLGGLTLLVGGGVFGLPWWWGPRWYRRRERLRRVWRAGNSLRWAAERFPGPVTMVSGPVAGAFSGERRARWRGSWVYGPGGGERRPNVPRKGAVAGTLTCYENGLTFAATRRGRVLRDGPAVLALPASDITRITVVPPGADADGVRRTRQFFRSPWPRLVIHTMSAAYIFEITLNHAKNAAAIIARSQARPSEHEDA